MPQNPSSSTSSAHLLIRILKRLTPLDCFREERFWRYALLPLAGSILPVLILSSHKGNTLSESLVGLVSAVVRALPAVLLVRLLDRDPAGPFRLRVSWPALALCLVGFGGAIVIGAQPTARHGLLRPAVFPLLLMGLLAGVASAVPPREIVRRAARHRAYTGLALVGLLPYVHRLLLEPEWRVFHPVSITLTRLMLDTAGIATTTADYWHRQFGFAVLLRAEHWEVLVSKECSGFARVVIFAALFASMLLQNPARLRPFKSVRASFIAGLLVALCVEPVRWAALVAYAERTVRQMGRTPAVYQAIQVTPLVWSDRQGHDTGLRPLVPFDPGLRLGADQDTCY